MMKIFCYMVGSVFGEFAFMPLTFDKTKLTEEEMRTKVKEVYGEKSDELIEKFMEAYPDKKIVDLHSSIVPKFMFGGDVEIQH